MGTGPDAVTPAGGDHGYSVDARKATGVQVGEGNTQIIYSYGALTWSGGPVPPPLATVSGEVDSPYRGLAAFEERDAAFFFGREAAASEILERLSRHLGAAGLVVVSGVSGAGKSSLLRAGVLPRIRGAGLAGAPESVRWPCLVLTPTRSPLDELAAGAASLAGADAASVRRELWADPGSFALIARQAADSVGGEPGGRLERKRLLMVVDQFEQIFTQCESEEHRQAFVQALNAAASDRQGADEVPAALIVLVVRADFEARCADYPQLSAAVQDRYLVTSMTGRQLRLAITEPARMAGASVDHELVEAAMRDSGSALLPSAAVGLPGRVVPGAGVLPLLSHALDQAWRNRASDTLRLGDYERAGGIEGAVAASARRAYDRLTPDQQDAARQIFMRLTVTSSDGAVSADRASRAELTAGRSVAEIADLNAVIEAFSAERLLTLGAESVEISHEILLTAWDRLREWLDGNQVDRVLYSEVAADARTWDAKERDPSYLYRAGRLAAVDAASIRWASSAGRYPPLLPTAEAFLRAARNAARRTRRRGRATVAALLVLTMAAVTAAGVAARNAANANRQHAIALSRQLAADSLALNSGDPVAARQLAVAAWSVFPTSQASAAMTTLVTEQQQTGSLPDSPSPAAVTGVAFSPGGRLLASADADGFVRLWAPSTGRPAGQPLPADPGTLGGVAGLAFSADGKMLATADADGYVRLWDPATGRPIGKPLPADPASAVSGVAGVAFSADGKMLAAADADGYVRLWDPATGRPIGKPLPADPLGGLKGVAFSAGGKLLATADADGYVRLWDPATGRPIGKPLPADPENNRLNAFGVEAVAFSPRGSLLASAGADGYVKLWNSVTGRTVRKPLAADPGITGGVHGLAFSPDGNLLASADADGYIQIWDSSTGNSASTGLPADPQGGPNAVGVSGVAFSKDGMLASADADGNVRLMNPATGRPLGAPLLAGSGDDLTGVAFSPSGSLLAGTDEDGYVRLWRPATGRPVGRPLPADPGGGVNGVAFSPDGGLLASADGNGYVRLWRPATGRPVGRPLPADPNLKFGGVSGVAFSPSGGLLASADENGYVRLWNPVTGRSVGRPLPADPGGGGVNGVAFSPGGGLLASADENGYVRLWNPVTGRPVGRPLPADPGGGVNGVAFSPGGRLLASADEDGYVRLWNPRSASPIGDPLPAGPDAGGPNASGVSGISFGPGGSVLASASGDGTVQPWALWQVTAPYAALCADVGPPAKADWAHYAPDESQPHTCVGYATPSGISARVPRASGQVTQLSGSAPQRRQAADQLSALLAQSTLDRGSINNAYNDVMSCGPTLAQDAATFQEAVVSRQSLVRSLASMPGANLLPVSLIQSLTQAWSASISADQDYAEWAGDESANCTPNDSDSNLAAAAAPDDQATQDKATFVSQWNPIATRYGLPTYAQDQF